MEDSEIESQIRKDLFEGSPSNARDLLANLNSQSKRDELEAVINEYEGQPQGTQ